MRKLAATTQAVASVVLLAAAVLLFVADRLGVFPITALLALLPAWVVPNYRKLAFAENLLLGSSLVLAGGAFCAARGIGAVRPVFTKLLQRGVLSSIAVGLRAIEARAKGWHLAAATAMLILASIVTLKGGSAHPELRIYVPHYLSNEPVVDKLFDFRGTEMLPTIYEPRQLSYLVDMLDTYGIARSVKIGLPHFISISYYLTWCLICWLLWYILRFQLLLDRLTAALLILMVQTTPTVFMCGSFFRSAKPGMTMCAVGATILIFRLLAGGESRPIRRLCAVAGACALLFCSALFDMIGACMIVLAMIHAGLEVWLRRRAPPDRRVALTLLACLTGTLCLYVAWNYILSPAISHHLIGQRPVFGYQTGTLKGLLVAPLTDGVRSVLWLLDVWRYFLGNLPIPVMLLMLVSISVATLGGARTEANPGESAWACTRLTVHLTAASAFLILLARLLVARHLPLLWIAVRRSAYGLPFTVACCIFIGCVLSAAFRTNRVDRTLAQAALILLLAGNVLALPEHAAIMLGGQTEAEMQRSAQIREQLRHPANAADIPELVRHDPLYIALRQFQLDRK